jgi:FdhE protein
MTLDEWIERHPYLRDLAELDGRVRRVVEAGDVAPASEPDWETYGEEFREGVPLLRSATAAIDRRAASLAIASAILEIARPGEELPHLEPGADLVEWVLDGASAVGIWRLAGCAALKRHLHDLVMQFAAWRDEDRWLRHYCPTCGALPAMAQLMGSDPGRMRLLSCACCGTRWRYRRTGCPFCEEQGERREKLIAEKVGGEGGLRLDSCEVCKGYLKTYEGEGSEDVFLADWTSLHLDIIALDGGLQRMAESLFDVGSIVAQPA